MRPIQPRPLLFITVLSALVTDSLFPLQPTAFSSSPSAPSSSAAALYSRDNFGFNTSGALGDPIPNNTLVAYDRMQAANVGFARGPDCTWQQAEPDYTHQVWDLNLACDPSVDDLVSRNFQPVIRLWYSQPGCTTGDGTKFAPPCDYNQFYNYVYRVVSRYGPNANGFAPESAQDTAGYGQNKVLYYELGNEPNVPVSFHVAQSAAASTYARLLYYAYKAVHDADPSGKCQLVIGGLATGGVQTTPNFFTNVLNNTTYDAKDKFDIMNFHEYGDLADFDANLASFRTSLSAVGVGSKPIWVTETGHGTNASIPVQGAATEYPNTEQGQSDYISDMIPHILNAGVQKVFLFTSTDIPTITGTYCSHGVFYYTGYQCNQHGNPPSNATLMNKLGYTTLRSMISNLTKYSQTTVDLIPIGDTYIDSDLPTSNFGTSSSLITRYTTSQTQTIYLKFDLSPYAAKNVTDIKLKIKTTRSSDAGSMYRQNVKLLGNPAWSELNLTWNLMRLNNQLDTENAPVLYTLTPPIASNTIYEFPLEPSFITPYLGKTVTFAIEDTSSDNFAINSRETADAPVLEITYAGP